MGCFIFHGFYFCFVFWLLLVTLIYEESRKGSYQTRSGYNHYPWFELEIPTRDF